MQVYWYWKLNTHIMIATSFDHEVRFYLWSSLTSNVGKIPSPFSAVWASPGMLLVLFQAGFAVHPPAAHYLVRGTGNKKADLALQFVWWCVQLAGIPAILGNIESHCSYGINWWLRIALQIIMPRATRRWLQTLTFCFQTPSRHFVEFSQVRR